jgi:hypothetical protein
MKSKIYIAHSSSYDFQTELYIPVKNSRLYQVYNFILPHDNRAYHPDSKKEIRECKVFIAEISHASTGAGIEIGWADAFNVPIIFLHKSDYKPPAYYQEMSKHLCSYSSPSEIPGILETAINQIIN